MPRLLRKVKEKLYWDWEYAELKWLPPGEFPAFPLPDLESDMKGEMSAWLIDEDGANLNRILAALAANRDHADKLDYILFDRDLAARASLEFRQSLGTTKDQEANAKWHLNLMSLTDRRAIALAKLIHDTGSAAHRVEPNDVEILVRDAVAAGQLKIKSLGPNWRKFLQG